ncbi:MAG: hypothetical protein Q7T71_14330, partial [Herbiconiux sp.]|nr:hypothetical protein [Herbiconiux sp.]
LARVLDGTRVAQLLRPWRPPVRIAFFLRAGGALYESVASSRVRFTFFDLTRPLDEHLRALDAGGPVDVLVAPASVLQALAEAALSGALRIRPGQTVSVAEVLDPDAADTVERAWGTPPRQVYQATEGLLALSCEHGALHLAEESVLMEREWLDAERTRFIPLVTDLERRTQIVARHRLDDVLRLDARALERCRCGRVTTVLAAVDGRADAVLQVPSLDGRRTVPVFPDALRQAVLTARPAGSATAVEGHSAPFADWRLRQVGTVLHVALRDPAPGAEAAVVASLGELLDRYGFAARHVTDPRTEPAPPAQDRRITREPAG